MVFKGIIDSVTRARAYYLQYCAKVMIANFVEFRALFSTKFRRTFALETCEISCRLSEISKRLTKFHRIFAQEKCEISPNLHSRGVRNFERRDENFVQNA